MPDLKAQLREADIPITEEAMNALAAYQDMLLEWNTRMDLTSVSGEDMGARHFVDSLLPLTKADLFPESCRLIDVGTGAGFPGLALAIARPQWEVTLLEAQGKRCQFLNAVCEALNIQNVTVIQERAEVLGRDERHREAYDRAIARAVAPLNVLCEYLLPFVKAGGQALCWKGPAAAEEMEDGAFAAESLGGRLGELVDMPLRETRHVLAVIEKIEKTPPQYPRKNGIPVKRPLKSVKKG